MTATEVRICTLDELLREADRHPGAATLAAEVRRSAVLCSRGSQYGIDVARARLEGWLERHLADPETGEADRLLAALEASSMKDGLNLAKTWTGGWILNCLDGPVARGKTPREALRAAFPAEPPGDPAGDTP